MLFPEETLELHSPIKWAGGKKFIVNKIRDLLMANNNKDYFVELFAGSIALTLEFQPKKAIINDLCFPLINTWRIIKEFPEELCEHLKIYGDNKVYNNAAKFNQIKAEYNRMKFEELNNEQKILLAAYFIYLNKRSFNGLYRENKSGLYNVPFRLYKNCEMYSKENILNISKYFNENEIEFCCGSYKDVKIPKKSLVYIDPPYYPCETSDFTQYNGEGFSILHQEQLAKYCIDLNKKKIKFIESNSPCTAVIALYDNFEMETFNITRSMRSAKTGKDKKDDDDNEILIWN